MKDEQDQDLEKDDELEGSEPEESKEPEKELPQDPNEPITVETDESKISKRRQARQERQNRFRQMEEENSRLRRETEELRQRSYYQPPPQQPQQPQEHPAAAKLREIDSTTSALHREYEALAKAGAITPEIQKRYEDRALQLQTAKMAAVAYAAQPQVDHQEIVRKAMWAQFTSNHADVFHDKNPNVAEYAMALYRQKLALGAPDSNDTAEEVLDQTRIAFGKQPRKLRGSRPDSNTKARFTGIASRGGGGGDMGEEGEIRMGTHEKRMARIAFGNKKGADGKPLTEKQQYQMWANKVGKKLAAQKKTG